MTEISYIPTFYILSPMFPTFLILLNTKDKERNKHFLL